MDKEKVKRIPSKEVKRININIKISKSVSDWLKDNSYSPTGIFNEAIKELGYKGWNLRTLCYG